MPNRWIRESCRTSKNLAKLSDRAERLFWRLTTCADDYGRFIADSEVVRSQCFPYRSQYLLSFVKTDLHELIKNHLVTLYTVKDRMYGQFCTWEAHQGNPRAKYSKYPENPKKSRNLQTSVNNSSHMFPVSDVPALGPLSDSDSESNLILSSSSGRGESERDVDNQKLTPRKLLWKQWAPNGELKSWAAKQGVPEDQFEEIVEDCRSYWLDQPESKVRTNQEATFKNRVRQLIGQGRFRNFERKVGLVE